MDRESNLNRPGEYVPMRQARKGFTVGIKDVAFIVAILALVLLVILVSQGLIDKVPKVVDELINTMLGGLKGGGG